MVELTLKNGEQDAAKNCPEFHSIDAAFFNKKSKLVPNHPKKIED